MHYPGSWRGWAPSGKTGSGRRKWAQTVHSLFCFQRCLLYCSAFSLASQASSGHWCSNPRFWRRTSLFTQRCSILTGYRWLSARTTPSPSPWPTSCPKCCPSKIRTSAPSHSPRSTCCSVRCASNSAHPPGWRRTRRPPAAFLPASGWCLLSSLYSAAFRLASPCPAWRWATASVNLCAF